MHTLLLTPANPFWSIESYDLHEFDLHKEKKSFEAPAERPFALNLCSR